MINIETIKGFFPEPVRNNPLYNKYMLKEYIQLMILDYLSTTEYIRKIVFIGGTNLRLVKGIDRFSEDLDFDCGDLSREEFIKMSDDVLRFLMKNGLKAIAKDRESTRLEAFRRSIYFPELLFDLGLSNHREERFLIKLESQDQEVDYNKRMANIKGCGFFFPFPVPSDKVLCAMKISAMISRQKGRDFYDVMFLLQQGLPDFNFLSEKHGISDLETLKQKALEVIDSTDLEKKSRDFKHLVFNKEKALQILRVREFFENFFRITG